MTLFIWMTWCKKDVLQCVSNGVTSFLHKPIDIITCLGLVSNNQEIWGSTLPYMRCWSTWPIEDSRDQSRYAPSQWETALQCKDVSRGLHGRIPRQIPCIVKVNIVVKLGLKKMTLLRDSWVLLGSLNNVIRSTKWKETVKQKSSTPLPMAAQWAPLGTRVCICMPIESWSGSCLVCVRDWYLTHWGRVTHICDGNLTIIGSDSGLSPGWRQAINWTNAGILLIGRLETNFSEILIQLLTFSFKKMCLKVSTAKQRLFCLGINVLKSRNYHLLFLRQHWFYSNGFGVQMNRVSLIGPCEMWQ